jgi:hypothetical protein
MVPSLARILNMRSLSIGLLDLLKKEIRPLIRDNIVDMG